LAGSLSDFALEVGEYLQNIHAKVGKEYDVEMVTAVLF